MGSMAYEIPVTQARAELAELINRVVYGGERVVVTRHGKPLVALVSAADLERLEDEEAAEQEQVISSVSSIGSLPSATGERHRFGIAAEHRGRQGPGSDAEVPCTPARHGQGCTALPWSVVGRPALGFGCGGVRGRGAASPATVASIARTVTPETPASLHHPFAVTATALYTARCSIAVRAAASES